MSKASDGLKYRSDIDGLRAVAVLVVVLFHAGVPRMTGGFVGVDVFFVISGYLITTILLHDQSIVRFYQRRARRILPALFVMIAAVLAVGLIMFLPGDLTELSRSAGATLLFFSNMFFWRKAGYFASETDLWPLLHTWSLGVEEQFYIVFPLLVALFRRLPPRRMAILFAIVGLASFGLAVFGMESRKTVLVFYLAPTRAWELIVGSILATGVIPDPRNRTVKGLAALGGLIAVLIPVFTYKTSTHFPGIGALPPVLGSAALIWAGRGGGHALSPALGWAPVRFIGLISYSLYLWHWPVLAFASYASVEPIAPWMAALAVALAFILAVLSWRYVERPFRRGGSDRTIWLASLGGILFFLGVCGVIVLAKGFPNRFSKEVVALNSAAGTTWRCPVTTFVPLGGFYACPVNLPSGKPRDADIVLWGDSHAQMYVPALRTALGTRRGLLVNVNGCAPVKGQARKADCMALQRGNYEEILRLPAKTVILAQSWQQYRDEARHRLGRDVLPEERYMDAVERLRELVAGLRAAGKKVVLVGPTASPGYDIASIAPRDLVFRGGFRTPMATTREAYLAETANVRNALVDLARDPGVRVIWVDRMACDEIRCSYLFDGKPMFSDHSHYTAAYAARLSPLFAEALGN